MDIPYLTPISVYVSPAFLAAMIALFRSASSVMAISSSPNHITNLPISQSKWYGVFKIDNVIIVVVRGLIVVGSDAIGFDLRVFWICGPAQLNLKGRE